VSPLKRKIKTLSMNALLANPFFFFWGGGGR